MPELGLRVLEAVGGAPVLSPLGLHAALATVRSCASGPTRAALDALLGPDPAPLDLEDESAVELLRAQGIWIDTSARLADGFAAEAAARGIRADTLEFADPGAPAVINAWAAERTRGMIARVLEELTAEERLVLTDAVFFDGAWTDPFDPDRTTPGPFRRADGSTREVPMMHADGHLQYAEHDGLEAIRLPYGNTQRLQFWAVAGPVGGPPEAPLVDDATWSGLRERFRLRAGSLAVPRLRLEAELELHDPLAALGLAPAFEPSHDLDGVFTVAGGWPTALGRVLQRARVDLDEQGTRAAAVTTVTAIAASARTDEPPPFDLRLDRPFVWGIEEEATGTLLFVGVVEDPGMT